jgi:hypothetical protein
MNNFLSRILKNTMLLLLGIWIFYSAPSGLTIIGLGLIPVISQKMILPLAGVYPFETTTFATYLPVYLYQVVGLGIGAASNIATDTCGVALLLHVRAQIDRLGLQLSKVPLKGGNLGHYFFAVASIFVINQPCSKFSTILFSQPTYDISYIQENIAEQILLIKLSIH